MSHLPIFESFHSWQGEGAHMGRSAFFIRTYGCPLKCKWCDSAATWDGSMPVGESFVRMSVSELLDAVKEHEPEIVVITGGEPTIHDLSELSNTLRDNGFPVHLETAGCFPIKGNFDWITVSPKKARPPLAENIEKANEIKLIVENETSIPAWVEGFPAIENCDQVWLNPEWSKARNPELLDRITTWVKERGRPYRAGWQLHKLYKADELDERSRPEFNYSEKSISIFSP